jgi:hypothetical protein
VKPSGFRLEPIVFGFGIERFYQLKVRRLKTQTNHELRLKHVVLPAGLRRGQAEERAPCACRKSNSHIQMMKTAKKWRRQNATNGMYGSRRRRVLVE